MLMFPEPIIIHINALQREVPLLACRVQESLELEYTIETMKHPGSWLLAPEEAETETESIGPAPSRLIHSCIFLTLSCKLSLKSQTIEIVPPTYDSRCQPSISFCDAYVERASWGLCSYDPHIENDTCNSLSSSRFCCISCVADENS